MHILFKTAKLRELCNDDRVARKKLGARCAKKLRARLDDLDAAQALQAFRALPGGCHQLTGNLSGCLSIALHGGFRLVFRPAHETSPRKPDGGLDWARVTKVEIVSIEDYHD